MAYQIEHEHAVSVTARAVSLVLQAQGHKTGTHVLNATAAVDPPGGSGGGSTGQSDDDGDDGNDSDDGDSDDDGDGDDEIDDENDPDGGP